MSNWGYRVCAACSKNLADSEYSQTQWRKGLGLSRCRICVQENFVSDKQHGTTRENDATGAAFDFNNVIGEGTFRLVALGTYTKGYRTGQKCVGKWLKDDSFNEHDFIKKDLQAVEVAARIIGQWNSAGFIDATIRLNAPHVWNGGPTGQLLVEPYIDNFEKFNSNTGWVNNSNRPWFLIMQALSHYSYHVTSGMYLLCDLQGGIYRDGAILTDPVIESRFGEFGPTDLGPAGMSTFFCHHRCNAYCQSNWTQPKDSKAYYRAYKGSTYVPPQEYNDANDDSSNGY